jgi:isoleucyl-tRNA synthetase
VAGHDALIAKWTQIRAIRADVLKRIEEAREGGAVGSSLQAEVDLYLSGERHALLATLGDDLRFVTITSRATLHAVPSEAQESIQVAASRERKCDRCWHWRADVGSDGAHPTLCGRCVANLFGAGEPRSFA